MKVGNQSCPRVVRIKKSWSGWLFTSWKEERAELPSLFHMLCLHQKRRSVLYLAHRWKGRCNKLHPYLTYPTMYGNQTGVLFVFFLIPKKTFCNPPFWKEPWKQLVHSIQLITSYRSEWNTRFDLEVIPYGIRSGKPSLVLPTKTRGGKFSLSKFTLGPGKIRS